MANATATGTPSGEMRGAIDPARVDVHGGQGATGRRPGMAEIEPPEPRAAAGRPPLTRPGIYLLRMAVFLVLCGFLAFILLPQLRSFFFANPGLNGLIFGVLGVGILLAFSLVLRLDREVGWVNAARAGDGRAGRVSALLGPLAAVIARGEPGAALPLPTTRALLDSVGSRLDETREVVRYLAGLLVFLGLVGTFWGLIETVGSVGDIIAKMRTGAEAGVLFDELKTSLAAPLSGMAVSFSSSLFGLSSSLVLGFLDLQVGRAQNRFFTELEDVLTRSADAAAPEPARQASLPPELAEALNRLSAAIAEGSGRQRDPAIANLAEGIQGLVQHMRSEQQIIRDWVEAQATRERELRGVLERLARERAV